MMPLRALPSCRGATSLDVCLSPNSGVIADIEDGPSWGHKQTKRVEIVANDLKENIR